MKQPEPDLLCGCTLIAGAVKRGFGALDNVPRGMKKKKRNKLSNYHRT